MGTVLEFTASMTETVWQRATLSFEGALVDIEDALDYADWEVESSETHEREIEGLSDLDEVVEDLLLFEAYCGVERLPEPPFAAVDRNGRRLFSTVAPVAPVWELAWLAAPAAPVLGSTALLMDWLAAAVKERAFTVERRLAEPFVWPVYTNPHSPDVHVDIEAITMHQHAHGMPAPFSDNWRLPLAGAAAERRLPGRVDISSLAYYGEVERSMPGRIRRGEFAGEVRLALVTAPAFVALAGEKAGEDVPDLRGLFDEPPEPDANRPWRSLRLDLDDAQVEAVLQAAETPQAPFALLLHEKTDDPETTGWVWGMQVDIAPRHVPNPFL